MKRSELRDIIVEAYVELLRETPEVPALKTSTQLILGKFPTLKKSLVKLLTHEFDEFIEKNKDKSNIKTLCANCNRLYQKKLKEKNKSILDITIDTDLTI
jgi:hypothetical protein